jgi:hypothetical protein
VRDCRWPGCRKQVDDWRWGCGSHWHMLPPNIQEKIHLGMQGALDEARAWIIETFGAQERREYDPSKWETLVRMVRTRDETRARRRAATGERQDAETDTR